MATFPVLWDIRGTLNGRSYVFASPSTPPSVVLTELFEHTLSLATATTAILWSPTTAGFPAEPASLDFFYALPTVAMFLELTVKEADAAERVSSLPLAANLPFVLFADDGFYNYTAGPAGDALTGTAGLINKLRVRNQSGGTGILTYALGKT